MEEKIKHLEFIQNIINRLSTNSFIVKGWSITIISGTYALSSKESNKDFILLTLFAIPCFWYINALFLMYERRYRSLYEAVRKLENEDIDFDMNIDKFTNDKNSFLSAMFSRTICTLYIFMLFITLIIMFVI